MEENELESLGISKDIIEKYKYYKNYMDKNLNFLIKSPIHESMHTNRVLLYSILLASKLQRNDLQDSLAICAIFHDRRRLNDSLDKGHGMRAANYYKDYCAKNNIEFNKSIYLTIYYHDISDNIAIENFSTDKSTCLMYKIFKDADALDRYRFGSNGLKKKYLRCPESETLISLSKKLNNIEE